MLLYLCNYKRKKVSIVIRSLIIILSSLILLLLFFSIRNNSLKPPEIFINVDSISKEATISFSMGHAYTDVYYSLDGTDPKVSTAKNKYTEPFTINSDTTIIARTKSVFGWSNISSKIFHMTRDNGRENVSESTGIMLSSSYIELKTGDALNLHYNVAPTSATAKAVHWKSSNPKIAMVSSDGKIKAIQPGEASIIVNVDNNVASCVVRVLAKTNPSNPPTYSIDDTDLLLIDQSNSDISSKENIINNVIIIVYSPENNGTEQKQNRLSEDIMNIIVGIFIPLLAVFMERITIKPPEIYYYSNKEKGKQMTLRAQRFKKIYYTLDGSDPQDKKKRQKYKGAIDINDAVIITAKARGLLFTWSEPIAEKHLLVRPVRAINTKSKLANKTAI